MADDQKDDNKENTHDNIRKVYHSIEFAEVEDKYDIILQYNANTQSIALHFTNQTTKNVFKHEFDSQSINKITHQNRLKPERLTNMIINNLDSKESVKKLLRIFLFPDLKQATAKSQEIQSSEVIPTAIKIPCGFQPKLDDNNKTDNNQLENWLLFVMHFSHPPYFFINYTFMLKEKDVSDYDRLEMRFLDLQKDNTSLKDTVNAQQQQIEQLINDNKTQQNQINALTQQFQALQTKVNDESKVEEIDLNLQNNWKHSSGSYYTAKAFKIGCVVYVKGLIKGGDGHIATLPQGWRPSAEAMFCLRTSGTSTRVNVYKTGVMNLEASINSLVSLEGIIFVTR